MENRNNKTSVKTTLRVCKNGHQYYKSSDCPTCPVCEKERKPTSGFMSALSAPARRALEKHGIKTLKQLSKYSELEVLKFHFLGPASIPILKKALAAEGFTFRSL